MKNSSFVKAVLIISVGFSGCKGGEFNIRSSEKTQSESSELNLFDAYNEFDLPDKIEKVSFDWKDSNKVIDGKGAAFNNAKTTMVMFESKLVDGVWKYPENITFQNWKINGALRVLGVGPSSDTTLVKESSHSLGHTERMREAAPRSITLKNLRIYTDEKIPMVLGPGVHKVTLESSLFAGKSRSVAIYVDAESGDNTIKNNLFVVEPSREAIALDGSARNQVIGNLFANVPKGAIHIYRNSGERGVVRHQKPRGNLISQNYFFLGNMTAGRAVFLGSRNFTNPGYRHDDEKFPFGSGISNRDYARDNVVEINKAAGSADQFHNRFLKDTEGQDGNNKVSKNERVEKIVGIKKLLKQFDETLQMPNLVEFVESSEDIPNKNDKPCEFINSTTEPQKSCRGEYEFIDIVSERCLANDHHGACLGKSYRSLCCQ